MEAWIAALINYVTSPLRDLVDAVKERISWVYSLISRVLKAVKAAQGRLFNAVANFRNWLVWAIGEGFLTLRWLILIRIPQAVANGRQVVIRWALGQIQSASNALRGLIQTLDRWARQQITGLLGGVAALKRWTTDRLNEVIGTLRRVRDVVFTLLTSPRRLATWLVGAMVDELWKYANGHADRIALWLRARSVRYTMSAANQIESIIARLL